MIELPESQHIHSLPINVLTNLALYFWSTWKTTYWWRGCQGVHSYGSWNLTWGKAKIARQSSKGAYPLWLILHERKREHLFIIGVLITYLLAYSSKWKLLINIVAILLNCALFIWSDSQLLTTCRHSKVLSLAHPWLHKHNYIAHY